MHDLKNVNSVSVNSTFTLRTTYDNLSILVGVGSINFKNKYDHLLGLSLICLFNKMRYTANVSS